MIPITDSEACADIRLRLGLSRVQIGLMLRRSHRTIQAWECGRSVPLWSVRLWRSLAREAFGPDPYRIRDELAAIPIAQWNELRSWCGYWRASVASTESPHRVAVIWHRYHGGADAHE